jgi:hypothetical protein
LRCFQKEDLPLDRTQDQECILVGPLDTAGFVKPELDGPLENIHCLVQFIVVVQ